MNCLSNERTICSEYKAVINLLANPESNYVQFSLWIRKASLIESHDIFVLSDQNGEYTGHMSFQDRQNISSVMSRLNVSPGTPNFLLMPRF